MSYQAMNEMELKKSTSTTVGAIVMPQYGTCPLQDWVRLQDGAHLLPCFSSCVGKMWVVNSTMCSRLRAAS